MTIPQFIYPFLCWWIFGLGPLQRVVFWIFLQIHLIIKGLMYNELGPPNNRGKTLRQDWKEKKFRGNKTREKGAGCSSVVLSTTEWSNYPITLSEAGSRPADALQSLKWKKKKAKLGKKTFIINIHIVIRYLHSQKNMMLFKSFQTTKRVIKN